MAIVTATKDNLDSLITGNGVIIVDFWAPWCGPCRSFAPVFEQVAEQHPDVVFAKVNTEVAPAHPCARDIRASCTSEQQELAAAFQIRSIPTLMVFREKVVLFAQPGALPRAALEQVVEKTKALDMAVVHREIEEERAKEAQA